MALKPVPITSRRGTEMSADLSSPPWRIERVEPLERGVVGKIDERSASAPTLEPTSSGVLRVLRPPDRKPDGPPSGGDKCPATGYIAGMFRYDDPPSDEPLSEELVRDSIGGLELQIIELVERQNRAMVQDRLADAAELQNQIDALHAQLARAADIVATGDLNPD